MLLLLYCVIRSADAPPAGLVGVGGATVRALAIDDGASAWVSEVAAAPERNEANARAHAAVVDAAMSHGLASDATPIPWSFGAVFADEGACRAALHAVRAAIDSELVRLSGLVEMAIAIAVPESERESVAASDATGENAARGAVADRGDVEKQMVGAGRAYLDAIRARQGLAQNVNTFSSVVRRRVSEIVGALARDEIAYVVPASPTALFVVAHLIHRGDVAAYLECARRIAIEDPTGVPVRLRITGPHAPYRFVNLHP